MSVGPIHRLLFAIGLVGVLAAGCGNDDGDASTDADGEDSSGSLTATGDVDGASYQLTGDEFDACILEGDVVSVFIDEGDVAIVVSVGEGLNEFDTASIQAPDQIWNGGSAESALTVDVVGRTVTITGSFNNFAAGTQSEGTIIVNC